MADWHSYDPLAGHGLPHDPFKAIVAPRPIGWFSTVDPQGRVNLAPYSFFNAFCDSPPIIGFGSVGWKDTLRNVEATGEFVFNLATRALAEAMNHSGYAFGPGVDEMRHAGLTPVPSTKVGCPRVGESPAALECKVLEIKPLHDLDGRPAQSILVLGQVVAVHIDRRYLKDGLFQTAQAVTIGRCGYLADYAEVDHLFEMERPRTEPPPRR